MNDTRKKKEPEISASEYAAAEQPAAPQECTETPDNETTDGDSADGEVTNLSLQQQFDAMRAERDDNYDQMLRARAELENYRRRVQRNTKSSANTSRLLLSATCCRPWTTSLAQWTPLMALNVMQTA